MTTTDPLEKQNMSDETEPETQPEPEKVEDDGVPSIDPFQFLSSGNIEKDFRAREDINPYVEPVEEESPKDSSAAESADSSMTPGSEQQPPAPIPTPVVPQIQAATPPPPASPVKPVTAEKDSGAGEPDTSKPIS